MKKDLKRKNQLGRTKRIIGILSSIVLINGNVYYFVLRDFFEVDIIICNRVYFFSICAGLIGLSLYAIGRDILIDYYLKAIAIYFGYCLFIWTIGKLFNLDSRWVYLLLGGFVICIALSLHRHFRSHG